MSRISESEKGQYGKVKPALRNVLPTGKQPVRKADGRSWTDDEDLPPSARRAVAGAQPVQIPQPTLNLIQPLIRDLAPDPKSTIPAESASTPPSPLICWLQASFVSDLCCLEERI